MRTCSHALLTWAAARRSSSSEPGVAVWGALGGTLPDLPAIAGALWLGAQRRRFTRRELREEACKNGPFGGPDARLIRWPVSRRRFRSPISYWERSRHARLFAPAEHGALLLLAVPAISRDSGHGRGKVVLPVAEG